MTNLPIPANDNRPAWFDQLLLDYQPFIYKRCIAEPNIDVEATAQEITLRAMEKWHQYKPTANFAVWLSFMCRDVLRKPWRDVQPGPIDNVPATQEFAADIPKVLSRLTRREARAVTMRAMGHTMADTAKKMHISSRALYDVLVVARGKLANEPALKAA